ncbi:hypothetical protein Tco_1216733 [Tanacetum coccineum]
MEAIQSFLKKYDQIPPKEKSMALLLAEERFLKIKQALEEEHNQPEDIQELLLKIIMICKFFNEFNTKTRRKAARVSSQYWKPPIFYNAMNEGGKSSYSFERDIENGDVDEIELLLHRDMSTHKISVASILEGITDEPPLEENDNLFDLESKETEWKKILYDAPIDDLMTEDKVQRIENEAKTATWHQSQGDTWPSNHWVRCTVAYEVAGLRFSWFMMRELREVRNFA